MIWIDARTVLRPTSVAGTAVHARPDDIAAAAPAIKTIAEGRQPVYLVAAKAEEYAAIRRALKESGLPDGPAWWLTPGREAAGLAGLAKASTGIDAVLLCGTDLTAGAAAVTGNLMRVPAAGQAAAAPDDKVIGWQEVVEKLSSQGRAGRGAGEVK